GRGNEAGGHGCSGAARGAARRTIWCVRILYLAETRVVTRQAVGHLDEVVLAEDQCARTLDGADSVGIFVRHEASEAIQTQARRQSFRQITVLRPERYAQ